MEKERCKYILLAQIFIKLLAMSQVYVHYFIEGVNLLSYSIFIVRIGKYSPCVSPYGAPVANKNIAGILATG